MSVQKSDKHVLYVPPGYENNPQVLAALAEMRIRFGTDNVVMEVDRAAVIEPDGDDGEGGDRRVFRLDPDPDR